MARIGIIGSGLLMIGLVTAGTFADDSEPGRAMFVSAPGENTGAVKSVVLSLSPENSMETVAVRDIVTAHLFGAGIRVISEEALDRTGELLRRKVQASEEQNKEKVEKGAKEGKNKLGKKFDTPLIDVLSVIKEAGGCCLIKITIIGQTSQQNVYDKENRRVVEVRTENRVSLVTANVVDVERNVTKVGSISYVEPVSVAVAAAELGRALVGQLTSK